MKSTKAVSAMNVKWIPLAKLKEKKITTSGKSWVVLLKYGGDRKGVVGWVASWSCIKVRKGVVSWVASLFKVVECCCFIS